LISDIRSDGPVWRGIYAQPFDGMPLLRSYWGVARWARRRGGISAPD